MLIDEISLSLILLIGVRLIAAIGFLQLYAQERQSQHLLPATAWLVYMMGPLAGLICYQISDDPNPPLFAYSAAVGTLLLIASILLYYSPRLAKHLPLASGACLAATTLVALAFPSRIGAMATIMQAAMLALFVALLILSRRSFARLGRISYSWLTVICFISIFHAFGTVFLYFDRYLSLRFTLNGLINFMIVLFFLHAEHNRSLLRLRESEERFRLLYERAPAGYQSLDIKGRFLTVNQAWSEILGYSPEEVIGRWFGELLTKDSVDQYRECFERFKSAGHIHTELEMVRRDGSVAVIAFDGRVGYGEDDLFQQTHCILHDITESVRAQEAIRASEAKYRHLFANMAQGAFYQNADSQLIDVNEAALSMMGLSRDQFLGRTSYDPSWHVIREDGAYLEPDEHPSMLALHTGQPVSDAVVGIYNPKTDAYAWASMNALPQFREGEQTPYQVFVTMHNITERKRAEDALRQREEELNTLVDNLPCGVFAKDREGRYTRANRLYAAIAGLPVQEIVGMTVRDLASEDVVQEWEADDRRVLETGVPLMTEQQIPLSISGRSGVKVIETRVVPLRDQEGQISGLIGFAQDISERRLAEDALRQSASELRAMTNRQQALLSALPDIVVEVDANKIYTWANPAGLAFFGEDVIGQQADHFFVGEQETYALVQPLFEGGEDTIYLESWQRRQDGETRLLAWWCRALKDDEGTVTGALSSARDITEQETLKAQLIQARKMEAVGQLAGGVAHDFNNMLQVIIGHTALAQDSLPAESSAQDDLTQISKAAERSAALTRQLLGFARRQTISPQVLDLNVVVPGMLRMLRRLIGEQINLVWRPGPRLWSVSMDPSQIDQILANLAVNARDAIKGTGTITIESRNVVLDDSYLETHAYMAPGDYVNLLVSDTGIGMDREVLDHLFEPFFTTKEVGQGTGLGLATVYGIVKQNGGFINIYSEPDQGTIVRIYLPRVAAEEPPALPEPPQVDTTGHETVLIVEDEEMILRLGVAALTRKGYKVLSAQSPARAIELAQNHEKPIDLLITDVIMPEMHGRDLRDKITALHPRIKTLFMSGYTAEIIADRGVLDEGTHFMPKPFSPISLASRARAILDGEE